MIISEGKIPSNINPWLFSVGFPYATEGVASVGSH
jgi:hypothetical protein